MAYYFFKKILNILKNVFFSLKKDPIKNFIIFFIFIIKKKVNHFFNFTFSFVPFYLFFNSNPVFNIIRAQDIDIDIDIDIVISNQTDYSYIPIIGFYIGWVIFHILWKVILNNDNYFNYFNYPYQPPALDNNMQYIYNIRRINILEGRDYELPGGFHHRYLEFLGLNIDDYPPGEDFGAFNVELQDERGPQN